MAASGRVNFFKGSIKGEQYSIKNWQDASKHNMVPLVQKMSEGTTFAMGVKLPDGRL